MSVLYYRVPRLFTDLAIAHGDGRYGRLLRTIARAKLLILDDWGPESLTPDQARDLLEIVEDRYDTGSLVITSQVPVDRWHDMIGVPTLADAILDRVVHNAYRIDLAGESLRKQRSSPEIEALLTNPDNRNIINFDLWKQAAGGRHQIGTPGRLQIGIGGRLQIGMHGRLPGALNYSIPSEPATVHDLLLQKSNGTFYLAVWDERSTGIVDPITVNLGGTHASVTSL